MKKSDTNRFQPKVEELERRDTPSTFLLLEDSQPILVYEDGSGEPIAVWLAPQVPIADYGVANDIPGLPDDTTHLDRSFSQPESNAVVPTALMSTGAAARAKKPDVLDPEAEQGLNYLVNYTRKSIRNYEQIFGTLPNHDDILQQVFLEWNEELAAETRSDESYSNLFRSDSEEKVELRKVIQRILHRERRHRTGREFADYDLIRSTEAPPHWQEAVDFQIDMETGVGRLSRQEYEILMGRQANKTFAEIAGELDVPTATIHDRYAALLKRLQGLYRQR